MGKEPNQHSDHSPSPPCVNSAHTEDEIDLAELFGVLVRRWRWIISITILVALASTGYALMQPPKYKASTFVEIGQTVVDQTYRNIESPEAVKNRIQSASRAIARNLEGMGPDQSLLFSPTQDLTVKVPQKGNIIQTTLKAPKDSAALAFLERINQNLIQAHNRISSQTENRLNNQIEQQNLAIERVNNKIAETKRQFEIKELKMKNRVAKLKDKINKKLQNRLAQIKRNFTIKRIQFQNRIKKIQGQIKDLQNEKQTLQENIKLLKQQKASLKDRIKSSEKLKQELLKSNIMADQNATSDSAISLMLFNSEILRVQRHLEDLRDKAIFKIPQEIANLQNKINALETDIEAKKASLDEAQTELEQLDNELRDNLEITRSKIKAEEGNLNQSQTQLKQLEADLKSKVEDLKAKIQEHKHQVQALKNQLKNMIVTKVIAKPQFSKEAVAPNMKLLLALGVVLGGFLGIFGAFFREFWVNNKHKIYKIDEHNQLES